MKETSSSARVSLSNALLIPLSNNGVLWQDTHTILKINS